MSAVNRDEYEICQRRGHDPSGFSVTIGFETWETCRFCDIQYRYGDPQLIERNPENEAAWTMSSPSFARTISGRLAGSEAPR